MAKNMPVVNPYYPGDVAVLSIAMVI